MPGVRAGGGPSVTVSAVPVVALGNTEKPDVPATSAVISEVTEPGMLVRDEVAIVSEDSTMVVEP